MKCVRVLRVSELNTVNLGTRSESYVETCFPELCVVPCFQSLTGYSRGNAPFHFRASWGHGPPSLCLIPRVPVSLTEGCCASDLHVGKLRLFPKLVGPVPWSPDHFSWCLRAHAHAYPSCQSRSSPHPVSCSGAALWPCLGALSIAWSLVCIPPLLITHVDPFTEETRVPFFCVLH